ncbi:ATP-binding protein, partial [Algoriphagus sp.]|uniref:ATP-binding protein n=1 Tax=Algoriphagus sp. TaxID=1872435 RepID=UPI0025DE993D
MVFLADNTFPNSIFYTNKSFQSQIGDSLKEKTLAGLGLDMNAYLYKEDPILTFNGKKYIFRMETPDENGSNYFLFHKGKEIKNSDWPSINELKKFFSSTKDIMAIGKGDQLTFINGAVSDILGYEAQELLNRKVCSLIPKDDLDKLKLLWRSNGGGAQRTFFETTIISKQGDLKTIECSVQFIKDHFFIIGRDISEKAKNKLLEKLLIESPDPLMIVYPDGKIFLANSEVKKLFGLKIEKELTHLSELGVLFDDSEIWNDWIHYEEKDATVQRFSSLLLNAEGKQLTLEIASKFILSAEQGLISLTFRNISEKVSLEKNLEENSEFLKNLTDQVPGGLYQMLLGSDGKMKFSFLSKGIGNVLGINPEEINDFEDISDAISRIHSLDIPKVIMSAVASARKQEPWQCQFRVKVDFDDTKYRWVLGAARPQVLSNGELVWYGYLTDISNQKEFEAKLDEARKTAEKASQIKSDFLSMISHELRTPLNAIAGSTYSLLQEHPSDSQKTELNTINFAVDNLIIMINDLLDFQKIEAGKLKIEKNPFNIQNLVNQIIKGLSFHARDSENKLDLKISQGLDIWLKGDKTRLSQVLNNLITNALKFTKAGNVDVTVLLKDFKDNQVKVYFEIKDTGIGIDKTNQELIFNDFDQVKPSFSTKYGGTGLGLSITRKLLNLMGGTIQLESEVGKGSRFYFELDFDLDEEQSFLKKSKKEDFTEPGTLNLLMAEDNDVNALVLGKIIKKWGYCYERVYNGEEAIKAVEKKKFDCVLMDIQMPVMDGFDATVAIKSFSDIPIIALTAASKLEIMDKIDECGFDGFVAKPIDAVELFKKIN